MTVFHLIQSGLGLLGLLVAGLCLWQQRVRTAVDARAYLKALTDAVLEQPSQVAQRLADGRRSAVGRLAALLLDPQAPPQEQEWLAKQLQREAVAGILLLRTLGRVATPLALIGAIVELGRVFTPQPGLLALQKGLVEQVAGERAILGLAIGACTSLTCFMAARLLYRGAQVRWKDLHLATEVIGALKTGNVET